VKMRDDDAQLVCESVEEFADLPEEEITRPEYLVHIRLQRKKNSTLDIEFLRDAVTAINDFPGEDHYEFVVRNGKWEARFSSAPGQRGVRYCTELHQRLEGILGPNSVQASPIANSSMVSASA